MRFLKIEILAFFFIVMIIIGLVRVTYEMFNETEPKKGFLKRLLEKFKNRKDKK